MTDHVHPSLERYDLLLKGAFTLYVVALLLSHTVFQLDHVWFIAMVFSIAMNGTYPLAAWKAGEYFKLEVLFALFLVALSIAGFLITPVYLIAAIILHGVWDITKHRGGGVSFFNWYTISCMIVDFSYAGVLIAYFNWGQT